MVLAVLLVSVLVWSESLPASSAAQSDGAAAASPAAHPPTRIGIAYGDTLTWMSDAALGATLDDAVTLNARWVRADLSWWNIQPSSRAGYRWGRFDRVVAAARQRGLRLLPILAYTPPWARAEGCEVFTCPPRDPAEFAEFARRAAARYAPSGVRAWEVWNEPNFQPFWVDPDPRAYADLLELTAGAVRSADPEATIVLGGLAATGDPQDGSIDARVFLDQVCRQGACRLVDGVAYHPYTFPFLASHDAPWGTPWNQIAATPKSLRGVLNAHGYPNKKVWVTEFGAPTGGSLGQSDGSPETVREPNDHVSEQRQAVIAADGIATAVSSRDVAALFWYSDRDHAEGTSNVAHFGLRRLDGTKKPSFRAFRIAAASAAPRR